MRELLADAIEATGELIAHAAKCFAGVIGRDFTDDEAEAYLRFAGADGLAESLGRLECESVDAAESKLPWCAEHAMMASRCARMPHSEGDEWTDERPTTKVFPLREDGFDHDLREVAGEDHCPECGGFFYHEDDCEDDCDYQTPAAIPPAADDPAGGARQTPAPHGATSQPGHSLTDSELYSAAADVIETWTPQVLTGGSAARWVAEFVDMLRDRAAQFGAVESEGEPFLQMFNAMSAAEMFPQSTKPRP